MRESVWGYAFIVLGIISIIAIWFLGNVTRTDQHNYNLLKETTEAAMFDALDLAAYRLDGKIRIEEEKFVENFIRRFAENADLSDVYVVEIYDVYGEPPKVSLKVSSKRGTDVTGEIIEFDIVNNIDAILETKRFEVDEYDDYLGDPSDGAVVDDKMCIEVNPSDPGQYRLGKEYQCEVGPGLTYKFYVLASRSEGTTDLIMKENLNIRMYRDGKTGDCISNMEGSQKVFCLNELTEAWDNLDDASIKLPSNYQLLYAAGDPTKQPAYGSQEDWWIEKDNTDYWYSLEDAPWLYDSLYYPEDIYDSIGMSGRADYEESAYWTSDYAGSKGFCVYYGALWAGTNVFNGYDCGLRPVINVPNDELGLQS